MGNDKSPTPLPPEDEEPVSGVRNDDGYNTVPPDKDLQAALLPDTAEHEFRIVLRGVSLDEKQQKQVHDTMQKAMLSELAKLDTGGDLRAAASEPLFRPAGGGLAGRQSIVTRSA